MQRFDDDDDDTIRIDILFLVASIVVWNQSGVTFSISLRCRDARWHRWLVELFSIPTPSFHLDPPPFFSGHKPVSGRGLQERNGWNRTRQQSLVGLLFPPPAVPTIQYHRQRTCHLSAPGIVVWLIINFIFSWGSVSNHWIVRRRRAAAAAKGAWNISLDISQAAYIVFFFF